MRLPNALLLPLLAIVLVLTAGQLWAAPVITIFDVKTTSPNGILDRDFRIGEAVKYKIGYNFSASSSSPRTVTGTVKVRFADGCVRKYEKVVSGVNPDEDSWIALKKKIPGCSSVANWVTVTYSINVGNSTASETGAIFVYPPLEPIARFSARPRYGEKPLKVYFTNKSLGTVETFDWDFGGGGVRDPDSPDHSPIYKYNSGGTYSVTLSITGPNGSDTKTKTDYITVVDPATVLDARFRAPRSERSVLWEGSPVTVNFFDRTVGTPDAWEWNFGDGSPDETVQNPSHDYTEAGLYSVVLKVSDSANSLEDQKTKLNYIYIYEEE